MERAGTSDMDGEAARAAARELEANEFNGVSWDERHVGRSREVAVREREAIEYNLGSRKAADTAATTEEGWRESGARELTQFPIPQRIYSGCGDFSGETTAEEKTKKMEEIR
jgi:hypothetical protein